MDIKTAVKQLPLTSGVYLMKDASGRIIYIGKAVSLRKRVQSYFRKTVHPISKTDSLVADIHSIDHIVVASEAEALLLEASLIKKYQPKYNVDLRDDKSYPSIMISDEAYPRIAVVRPRSQGKEKIRGRLFGPYVDAKLVREALTIIRRIFHYRVCPRMPKKPCLDHHIGLCDAPCVENISVKEYRKVIRHVVCILEGRKDELYKDLHEEMALCARVKDFERAAVIRDQIRAIGALYSGTKDINYFKEAEQLQRVLSLPKAPERIEAFDISNIMGTYAVGSMVSFFNGQPDKKNYRRFRIKEIPGIDDPAMIAQVVRRRYGRLKDEGALFPDLIVIDGGKGQLSAAHQELQKLQITIPLISLAKREEEVFVPQRKRSIVLPKDSLGLKMLQRVRDEAHRFAVSYHRSLRDKSALK